MKISVAASAALTSQTSGILGRDGRSLATRSNALHGGHHKQHRKSHQKMASTIISKLQDLRNVVECEIPTVLEENQSQRLTNKGTVDSFSVDTDSTDTEGEFGILSPVCGVGRKCQDGLCVDVEEWFQEDFLYQRRLQDGMNNETDASEQTTMVDTMKYACQYGSLVGYDCACDFDPDSAYTGSATCITPAVCTTDTSVCGVEVSDCYHTSYTLTLQGTAGAWDAELCLTFLEPYEQEVCYQTSTVDFAESVLPECIISLDGEQCTQCDVYAYGNGNCYNFDCGNTALVGNGRGSMAGNTCNLPAHSVGLYLDTYGCPPCDLCRDGMVMSSPASTMELFETSYQCAYVQDVALQGFFSADSCDYLAVMANAPCGCVDPGTPAPSASETEGTPTVTTISDMITVSEMSISDSPTSNPVAIEAECKICPEGTSIDPDGVIIMPGNKEASCAELEVAGMNGSIVGAEYCEAVQTQAAGPCCGAPVKVDVTSDEMLEPKVVIENKDYCTICGPDKIPTDDSNFVSVPTQGIYSCQELITMGETGTLDANGICLLVQLSAKTPCGCQPVGPTLAPTAISIDDVLDSRESSEPVSGASARSIFLSTSVATVATIVIASILSW